MKTGVLFLASLALILTSFASPHAARAEICAPAFSGQAAPVSTPKLVILSAPSGGGKTTLAHLLLKDFPRLSLSVSTTTRAPRGTEENGVDYHFISVDEFKAK